MMNYCRYFQAHVVRDQVWFFVAVMRSYEHVMFDRTLDTGASIFEFFVPWDMDEQFLAIMAILIQQGIVHNMHELNNRLLLPDAIV